MLAVQKIRIGLFALAVLSVVLAFTAITGLSRIEESQSAFSNQSLPVLINLNQINTGSAEVAERALEFVSARSPEDAAEISAGISAIYQRMTELYEQAVARDPSLEASDLVDLIHKVRDGNGELLLLSQQRFSLEAEYGKAHATAKAVTADLLYKTEIARDEASLTMGDPSIYLGSVNTFRRFFQIHQLVEKVAFRLEELSQLQTASDIANQEGLFLLHTRDLHTSITRVAASETQQNIAQDIVDLHDAITEGLLFEKRAEIVSLRMQEQATQVSLRGFVAQLREVAQAITLRQGARTNAQEKELTQMVTQTSRYLIFWSIAGVLGTIGLGFLVVERQIARRLSLVGRNAAKIEAGDFSEQGMFKGQDEIAALGRSVDRLRSMSQTKQKLNDEMRRASEEAQQAAKTKSEFLAMMSHEVRTPLNAILGLFELMIRSELPEKQLKRAKAGHKAATNLFKMLSDILDASRLEAGKMETTFEEMHVADLCDYLEVVMNGMNQKHSKNIEMAVMRSDLDEYSFMTDEVKVRQILVNLIDNAVRFTNSGTIFVHLNLDDASDSMSISVVDTGIGISEVEMDRIFQPFSQVEMGMMRTSGGSGLGLTISKDLAGLIGGKLTAESTYGEGSRFTLSVPLKPRKIAHAA